MGVKCCRRVGDSQWEVNIMGGYEVRNRKAGCLWGMRSKHGARKRNGIWHFWGRGQVNVNTYGLYVLHLKSYLKLFDSSTIVKISHLIFYDISKTIIHQQVLDKRSSRHFANYFLYIPPIPISYNVHPYCWTEPIISVLAVTEMVYFQRRVGTETKIWIHFLATVRTDMHQQI